MDSDSEEEVPKKCPRNDHLTSCVICGISDVCTKLTKPRDFESWTSLLNAAKIHNVEDIVKYEDVTEVPEIYYHTDCRRTFTHKKILQRIQEKTENPSISTPEHLKTDRLKRQGQHSTTRVYDKVCIFCDKVSKYKRRSNSRESLTQAVDLRSDVTVRRIAELKMDSKILALTSRDLVAAEAQYHISCYKDYTREKPMDHSSQQEHCDSLLYSTKEHEAYEMLFSHVRSDLLKDPEVVMMTSLTKELVDNMNFLGIQDVKPQTWKHISRKLEAEFGDSLEIVSDERGGLLVIPDNLSKSMLATENMKMVAELESYRAQDNKHVVKQCATILRSEIKKSKVDQPWPPQPGDLNNDYTKLPKRVYEFLHILLAGEIREDVPSGRIQRLIQSFGQDFIYAISKGIQKPAKAHKVSKTLNFGTDRVFINLLYILKTKISK